jgi:hypothetical protein
MSNFLRFSLTVMLATGASLAAVASEPVRDVAASPAAAAADAAPAAATDASASTRNEAPKVPPGYKVKVIDGETRFCRKSAPLGTRFPTETCMTEAQYLEQERNRDSMRNSIQDRQKSYSINN